MVLSGQNVPTPDSTYLFHSIPMPSQWRRAWTPVLFDFTVGETFAELAINCHFNCPSPMAGAWQSSSVQPATAEATDGRDEWHPSTRAGDRADRTYGGDI